MEGSQFQYRSDIFLKKPNACLSFQLKIKRVVGDTNRSIKYIAAIVSKLLQKIN